MQTVSFCLDRHSGEETLTAFLVFMESPVVPISVGTECGSQCSPRFIVGVAVVILVDGYFRGAFGHFGVCSCDAFV
jgi:hypothetical protein